MNVIFLDIDGVLNTTATFKKRYLYYKKTGKYTLEIDEFRLEYLKEIVDKTNSKIVLSSTWRRYFKNVDGTIIPTSKEGQSLLNLFHNHDLSIYDMTPYDKNRVRGIEINSWLDKNEVDNFVILDDDDYDLKEYPDNLLLIDTRYGDLNEDNNGLCEKHIEMAINILKPKRIVKKI